MLNEVTIIGRLGQDPELKYTPGGSSVCNLNVATTRKWNDQKTGQKQEKTEWHRIIVWGKIGENCNQYLGKGSLVCVKGRLETRSWDDKNGGGKRYATEIIAENVVFLSSKGEGQGNGGNRGNEGNRPQGRPSQNNYEDYDEWEDPKNFNNANKSNQYADSDIPF